MHFSLLYLFYVFVSIHVCHIINHAATDAFFLKIAMNIVPSRGIWPLYFYLSAISNTNMALIPTCVVKVTPALLHVEPLNFVW